MATGVVGTVSNSSLTYAPQDNAVMAISWVSTSTGTISVGGVVVAGGAAGNGVTKVFVGANSTTTITSSASTITAIVSALEELS